MLMEAELLALPLLVVMYTEGSAPWRALAAETTGRWLSVAPSTMPTEPDSVLFFWVPKPTTTTSSRMFFESSRTMS